MSIIDYLNYTRGKENKKDTIDDDDNSASAAEEIIEECLKKLETIIKENQNIKYDLKLEF